MYLIQICILQPLVLCQEIHSYLERYFVHKVNVLKLKLLSRMRNTLKTFDIEEISICQLWLKTILILANKTLRFDHRSFNILE